MQFLSRILVVLTFAIACFAQTWEVGAAAGGGIYKNVTATGPGGDATAGFKPGLAAGVVIGQDLYEHVGGEVRYTFRMNDLKASSGGQEVTFGGRSHAIHYDFLIFGTPRGAKVRPFLAVGGGVKVYEGTGKEDPFQPLSDIVILTNTHETKGMGSVGGGVKFAVGSRTIFRIDFRDYITPFPKTVIAPVPPPGKIGSIAHDFVAMIGISVRF